MLREKIRIMAWSSEGQRLLAGVLERRSREEVAEHCDVDPSTVSRWRAGSRTPTKLTHLKALAALGIPMESWDPPAELAA